MKKIIIILVFIILVAAIGYLLYFLFFKPVVEPTPSEAPKEGEEAYLPEIGPGGPREGVEPGAPILPLGQEKPEKVEEKPEVIAPIPSKIAKGGLTQVNSLSDKIAQDAVVTPDGSLRYYDKEEAKFYKVLPTGAKILFSEKSFYEVEKVNWSPDKNKALLEYPDKSKVLYDFVQKKQYTISKNWHDFSFSPDGGSLTFMTDSALVDNRWLAVSKPDGTEAQAIEPLGENADKVVVSWSPNNQIIAFSQTGEAMGLWTQEIYPIGLHDENFRSLIVNGRGFEPKWSPTGEKLLYSVYNTDSDYKPVLWLTDCYGDDIGLNNKSLKLNTWAHKCAFSSGGTELYCAVPISLEQGSGLFPEMNLSVPDNFYKINLKTGSKSVLAQPAGTYNAANLSLSPDETYLYFTDKISGQLQQIRLK